jgi:hypothetical protein
VFWLTAFVGEDYRRSRDAKALAAALAGEIESFHFAMALAEKTARSLLEVLANGQPVPPRIIPEPPETVYAANLERVGILGVSIGRDLPYAYHMIHAYRVTMTAALSANTAVEQKSGIMVAQVCIANANDVLPGLLAALQARARKGWRPFTS